MQFYWFQPIHSKNCYSCLHNDSKIWNSFGEFTSVYDDMCLQERLSSLFTLMKGLGKWVSLISCIGSKCFVGMINHFQELRHHRFCFSGKEKHTIDLGRGMDERGGKSISGKLPRASKMRSSIIIFLVLSEALILFSLNLVIVHICKDRVHSDQWNTEQ